MIRKLMMAVPAVLLAAGLTLADKKDDGFVTISNGKDFSGWKASENKDSWSMKDGAFVAAGPRSHLFYQADKPFTNFELKVDVMTLPGSNGGIYFHTKYQEMVGQNTVMKPRSISPTVIQRRVVACTVLSTLPIPNSKITSSTKLISSSKIVM